jgi:hypothetical protein
MNKPMIKQYTYGGFEDFYDYYRDASEILEEWNEEFKGLDGEFMNDVLFHFEVVPIGGKNSFEKLEQELKLHQSCTKYYSEIENALGMKARETRKLIKELEKE